MSKKPARRGREGENTETREVGRPRATLNDLPGNWKGIILALYSEGAADIEVRVARAIPPSHCLSQDLWERFMAEEKEFSVAINEGREVCRCWWERKGREGIDKPINNAMWIVQMRNRYGFRGADRNLPPGGDDGEKQSVQFYLPDNGRSKKVS